MSLSHKQSKDRPSTNCTKWQLHHGLNWHGHPQWPFFLNQAHPMWHQIYIRQHAENTTTGQPKCSHGVEGHLGHTMQDELYSTYYEQCFIIFYDPGPYPYVPAGTMAMHWAKLKVQHKNVKKAHDLALQGRCSSKIFSSTQSLMIILQISETQTKGIIWAFFATSSTIFLTNRPSSQRPWLTTTKPSLTKPWMSANSSWSTSKNNNNANHLPQM